jgi:hypothetical protein
MISGEVLQRFTRADLKSADPQGRVGSNPTLSANNATGVEALTPTPVFNHTAEAMWPKQPRLYASAVYNPREENTSWKQEKSKGLK